MIQNVARLGLRARATVAFAAVGLIVAILLAGSTLLLSSRYLVEQREDAALGQAYANARLIRSALRAANVDIPGMLAALGGDTGSHPVLQVQGEFFSGSLGIGRDVVPDSLLTVVGSGHVGHQRVRAADGTLQLIVGIALPAVDAAYFEVFPMTELDRTLSALRSSLLIATAITVISAAAIGRYAAGRVVQPLEPVASAAQQIAGGALMTRLPASRDPDLGPLTDAFNTMAASLEERVAREARFTSDVSHELRSPLAVLAASIDIIERRRADLPPTVSETFELLAERVGEFQTLVLELLEISRFDNGAIELDSEPVDIRLFVERLVGGSAPDAELVVDDDVPRHVMADRRRLGQALSNVFDNACRYAGGATGCHVHVTPTELVVDVDDCGPGVEPSERRAVFDRFARGRAGRRAGSTSGTGLGLALAAEHIKLHGGRIEAADGPGGGARFRITIPRIES